MSIKKIHLINKDKKIHDLYFENKFFLSNLFLSSCSAQALIIAGSLWIAYPGCVKAMDQQEFTQKTHLMSTKFYKDADHPLTQAFWKDRDLSQRLQNLKGKIEEKKGKILNYQINSISLTEGEVKELTTLLKCEECKKNAVNNLEQIHLDKALADRVDRGDRDDKDDKDEGKDKSRYPKGWSANTEVIVFPYKDTNSRKVATNFIAVKKYTNIKKGLEELFESLIALAINPAPKEIKMARIYDAVICPQDCLSIIMEAVNTDTIHSILEKNPTADPVNATAEYLAKFHTENHHRLNNGMSRKKYLNHAAQFFNSLKQNTLKEEDKEFKLLCLIPREKFFESEIARSNTVVALLDEREQEKFERLVGISCDLFKNNAENLHRALDNKSYFLTVTHGDAHAHNFFYDDSSLFQNGLNIPEDSLSRVSMIDFATIVKTYGSIGDPAEDVGRFLAALRNWGAVEQNKDNVDKTGVNETVSMLQREFLTRYLKTIKNSNIIEQSNYALFEKTFKENCNFYKLRYYRAIFNVEKDKNLAKDREIKKSFLTSWIKENASLETSVPQATKIIIKEKTKERPWRPVCAGQKDIVSWIPERSREYIESVPQNSNKSYLTLLWEELHRTGMAAIVGMGGVGKTSLALAYAHEAFDNRAYDLIYWIFSSTEASLLKSYKDLLWTMGDSPQSKADGQVIRLVKQKISSGKKCLLIYDNVPDPGLLKLLNKTRSQNAHILITSRCQEGWKQPFYLNIFQRKDSINYLCINTSIKDESIAEELADALKDFPLALSYAAHYINLESKTNQQEITDTFKKYLENFKKESTVGFFKDNKNPFTEAQSEITHQNLVAKTLSLSKTRLTGKAEELLTYFAYLEPDVIEKAIFIEHYVNNKPLGEALKLLSSLSLIKMATDNSSFSIHRLLQLVIMSEEETKSTFYKNIFNPIINVFNKLFKNNIVADDKIDALLNNFPHVLTLLKHSKRLNFSMEDIESLEWVGKILYLIGTSDLIRAAHHACLNDINQTDNNQKLDTTFQEATKFFQYSTKNDWNDLPEWLKRIAEKSQVRFQKVMGALYALGQMVKMNHEKAYFWHLQAANKEDAETQHILGFMLADGKGVSQNFIQALQWWKRAAKNNNADAQCTLGNVYASGNGDKQDYKKAVSYFTQAANQGNPMALSRLGMMYEMGHGVPQDIEEAIKLYTAAAQKGEVNAQIRLKELSQDQQEGEDDTERFKWHLKNAKRDNPYDQVIVGLSYEAGEGTPKNNEEALKWYKKAVEKGEIKAQVLLDLRSEMIQALNQSNVKAIQEAAEEGDGRAQAVLGYMYEIGHHVPCDNDTAIKWYQKAADSGNALAQMSVGWAYEDGETFEQDYQKAFNWYNMAAQQGSKSAQLQIALLYQKGYMGQYNRVNAIYLFKQSAEIGNYAPAQVHLARVYQREGNIAQEIYWLKIAAAQGHSDAQCRLGCMGYLNEAEALSYLIQAAEQDHPHALFLIANHYGTGRGVSKDLKKALDCLEKAADYEHPEALFILGRWHANGERVPKDLNKSLEYIREAANQGFRPAQAYLQQKKGDNTSTRVTNPTEQSHITVTSSYVQNQYLSHQQFYDEQESASSSHHTRGNQPSPMPYKTTPSTSIPYVASQVPYAAKPTSNSQTYSKDKRTQGTKAPRKHIQNDLLNAQIDPYFQPSKTHSTSNFPIKEKRKDRKTPANDFLATALTLSSTTKPTTPHIPNRNNDFYHHNTNASPYSQQKEVSAKSISSTNVSNLPHSFIQERGIASMATNHPPKKKRQTDLTGTSVDSTVSIQQAEEGNTSLTQHLNKEANKKYDLAGNAKRDNKFHKKSGPSNKAKEKS